MNLHADALQTDAHAGSPRQVSGARGHPSFDGSGLAGSPLVELRRGLGHRGVAASVSLLRWPQVRGAHGHGHGDTLRPLLEPHMP